MAIEQINVFGNIDIVVPAPPKRRGKTKTMQELYGTIEGKTCRTCKHCYVKRRSRAWYKCELWMNLFSGCSEASDIRLKNNACGKYEEEE